MNWTEEAIEDSEGEEIQCDFCPDKRTFFMRLSMNSMTMKYFVNFFFYFAKPINEIILRVPHIESVIMYYESQFWDDNQEYLNRYYSLILSKEQIRNLTGRSKRDEIRVTENRVLNKVQQVLERHTLLASKAKGSNALSIHPQESFRPTFMLQETAKIMQKREKKIRNIGKYPNSAEKKEGKVYETLLKGLESLLQEKRDVQDFKMGSKFEIPKAPEEEDSLKLEFESFLRNNNTDKKTLPKDKSNFKEKSKERQSKKVKSALNRNQLIMDLVKEFEEKTNNPKGKHKKAVSNEKKATVTVKSGAMTERSHKAKKNSVGKVKTTTVKNLSKLSDFKKAPMKDLKLCNFISPLPGKVKSGAKTTRDTTRKTKERISTATSNKHSIGKGHTVGKSGGIACRINLSKVHHFRHDVNSSKSRDLSKSNVNRPITERNLTCNRNVDDIYGFLTSRKAQKPASKDSKSTNFKTQKANILKQKARELVQTSRASCNPKKDLQHLKASPEAIYKFPKGEEGKSDISGPSINCKFNFKLDLRGIKREIN